MLAFYPQRGSRRRMTDTRTPAQRRTIMQSVKTKDTGPELVVRRALFALGYRFRLHRRNLPGRPDIVLPTRKKAIFVHGCYWHGHGCSKGRLAKSRIDYWGSKIQANRARDARNLEDLQLLGWKALTVWQCELADMAVLSQRLKRFVDDPKNERDKRRTKR
jgi:DNA mismatch endonuclease, patch repair protein